MHEDEKNFSFVIEPLMSKKARRGEKKTLGVEEKKEYSGDFLNAWFEML